MVTFYGHRGHVVPAPTPRRRKNFIDIAMASDGTLWVLGSDGVPQRHIGRGEFKPVPMVADSSGLVRPMSAIAVGSSSQVFGLTNGAPSIWASADGWQFLVAGWEPQPGFVGANIVDCVDIDAASDGTVCILKPWPGPDHPMALRWDRPFGMWRRLRHLDDQEWDVNQIAVGSATLIYGIRENKAVRLRITGKTHDDPAPDGVWDPLPDLYDDDNQLRSPISITAGSDGGVWVVGDDHNIYALKADASGWEHIGLDPLPLPPKPLSVFRIAGTDRDHLVALTTVTPDRYGNPTNDIWIVGPSSPTFLPPPVATFASPANPVSGPTGDVPAMAEYNGKLYCAYLANDSGHALIVRGDNAANWYAGGNVAGVPQTNNLMGSAPALAVLGSTLYCVYRANDPSNILYVTRMTGNDQWPTAQGVSNILDPTYPGLNLHAPMRSAPGLASFRNKLYCAYAFDSSHQLMNIDPATGNLWNNSSQLIVINSADGNTWITKGTPNGAVASTIACGVPGLPIGGRPALAAFKDRLRCAFQASDGSKSLFITSSRDGDNWVPPTRIGDITTGSDPALAELDDRLYCAYRADDTTHALCVVTSTDGVNWDAPQRYDGILMGGAPALCALDDRHWLYVAFQSNGSDHNLYLSYSGPTQSTPSAPPPFDPFDPPSNP
jgi:hypothetical protein